MRTISGTVYAFPEYALLADVAPFNLSFSRQGEYLWRCDEVINLPPERHWCIVCYGVSAFWTALATTSYLWQHVVECRGRLGVGEFLLAFDGGYSYIVPYSRSVNIGKQVNWWVRQETRLIMEVNIPLIDVSVVTGRVIFYGYRR